MHYGLAFCEINIFKVAMSILLMQEIQVQFRLLGKDCLGELFGFLTLAHGLLGMVNLFLFERINGSKA